MPRQPRMKIIFSSISNRDITLVSHQVGDVEDVEDEEVFESLQQVRRAIKDLDQSSHEQKLSFDLQPANFKAHVLVDRGIVFMCMTARTDSHYLPFAFLHKAREMFSEQPSLISRSYRAGEDELDRDFRPVLVQIMDDFNSGREDKFSQVEEQIEDIKQVMLHNVDKIMERGERLDDLLSKTEDLESQGQDFRIRARQVFVQARCRNLKLWLVIGVLFTIFTTIVILFVTGVIKS